MKVSSKLARIFEAGDRRVELELDQVRAIKQGAGHGSAQHPGAHGAAVARIKLGDVEVGKRQCGEPVRRRAQCGAAVLVHQLHDVSHRINAVDGRVCLKTLVNLS